MKRFLSIMILSAAVLALAACSGGGGDDDAGSAAGAGDERSAESASGEGLATFAGRDAGGEKAAATGGAPDRLPALGPRVIQTASLRVTVARGAFDDAVDSARTLAAGLGGFVVSSSESQRASKKPLEGLLVLRVPERSYARAMRSLSDLGRVVRREESGQDVSQEFVDLESRRRHLEAVEAQLLELLDRAGSVPAALAVQSQLANTQLQLEEVSGRLRYLADQTELATISLSLRERTPVGGKGDDDGVIETWKDGARAFVSVAGKTFVVLASIAPVVLLLALAYLAGRFLLRRRLVPGLRGAERG